MDGTQQQLEMFLNKMGDRSHWTGVNTEDHVDWRAPDGEILHGTSFFWAPYQPDNYGGVQLCVALNENGRFLNDKVCGIKSPSICDMMSPLSMLEQ